MTQPLRIALEITKQYWETRRGLIGYLISAVVLCGLYVWLRETGPFGYLTSASGRTGGPWIYAALVFCTGVALDVARSINTDIALGTLARLAQAPCGLLGITDGRFIASSVFSAVSMLLVAAGLVLTGHPFPPLSGADALILVLLLPQAYAVTLLMVGATLAQKNQHGAQVVGLLICLPLALAPMERIVGRLSDLILLAGPLARLRTLAAAPDIMLLGAVSVAWVVVARLAFHIVEKRLKVRGSLLYR